MALSHFTLPDDENDEDDEDEEDDEDDEDEEDGEDDENDDIIIIIISSVIVITLKAYFCKFAVLEGKTSPLSVPSLFCASGIPAMRFK